MAWRPFGAFFEVILESRKRDKKRARFQNGLRPSWSRPGGLLEPSWRRPGPSWKRLEAVLGRPRRDFLPFGRHIVFAICFRTSWSRHGHHFWMIFGVKTSVGQGTIRM